MKVILFIGLLCLSLIRGCGCTENFSVFAANHLSDSIDLIHEGGVLGVINANDVKSFSVELVPENGSSSTSYDFAYTSFYARNHRTGKLSQEIRALLTENGKNTIDIYPHDFPN